MIRVPHVLIHLSIISIICQQQSRSLRPPGDWFCFLPLRGPRRGQSHRFGSIAVTQSDRTGESVDLPRDA